MNKTRADGTVDAAGQYGPYIQSEPVNSLNDHKNVSSTPANAGFVMTADGKFSATNKAMDGVIE